jgi:hypothetical protein
MVNRKRKRVENEELPIIEPRRSKRLREQSKTIPDKEPTDDWNKWVSASSTRNYMLRDPLCDWLKHHYTSFITKNPSQTKEVLKAVSDNKSPNSFTEFIMEQGCVFESHVIKLIYKKFGNDMLVDIGGELNPKSPEKVQETIDAMNKGIPFIHSGLLHNSNDQTFGIPDLLVRSDWINDLVLIKPLNIEQASISAPKLTDIHHPNKSPKYHYLVVDIKFSTLYLRSDSLHILNCGSFPAYKAQLYIYNQALANIQGYDPKKAYILGRKWKYSVKGETYKGTSCFDRLGTIDYEEVDKDYVEKTGKAVEWIREVKSDAARQWNVTQTPLTRPELYPNMCNSHDYPWGNIKKRIAVRIKELTSVWMVGTKHRQKAHEQGIYEWTDPKCTSKTLGVNGGFTSKIITKILEMNQPRSNKQKNEIVSPKIIENDFKGWQKANTLEFYVDFETLNDVLTDFKDLPEVKATSLIFMIGVGYMEPMTEKWVYKNFTIKSLSLREEERICREFSEYIRSESSFYDVEDPLCVHWSHAEDTFWDGAIERHPDHSDSWESCEWEWFDLLHVFKEEPIIIKDCLTFKLKDVACTLQKHGLINTSWDGDSSCLDGQGAMVGAWRAHKESQIRQVPLDTMPQIKEIAKYNEVDVKVLYEIITYLRTLT